VGSKETRTEGGATGTGDTGKVVRIPRDWFGPKSELVPFGQSAAEDGSGSELPSGEQPAAPLDANLFWGEEAGSVQHVVDAPAGTARPQLRRRAGAVGALVTMAAVTLLAVSLLTEPGHRNRRAQVAEANRPQATPHPRSLSQVKAQRVRRAARSRVRTKTAHKSARAKTPLQVTYHAGQSRSVTPAVYTPPQPQSTSVVSSSAPAGSSVSQASAPTAGSASTAHSSQPAFGSSGALGPMSSPDG
jgi:hypothetical protein